MNVAKRGRPKKIQTEVSVQENQTKFERRYEDEDTIEIWKYDLNKSNGPVDVSITYKNGGDKNWAKKQKQAKEEKRAERQMKKINDRNKVKTGKRGRPKKK